jgi:hypothetical protein
MFEKLRRNPDVVSMDRVEAIRKCLDTLTAPILQVRLVSQSENIQFLHPSQESPIPPLENEQLVADPLVHVTIVGRKETPSATNPFSPDYQERV